MGQYQNAPGASQADFDALNTNITIQKTSFSYGVSSRIIPANILDCQIIIFVIRRYGYADSLVIPSSTVIDGLLSAGAKLKHNNSEITLAVDSSYNVSLSGTGSDQLSLDVIGIPLK